MDMSRNLTEAKRCLIEGDYTCVAVQGEQKLTSRERGVKPLLAWLDGEVDLHGFSVADKVIGDGAAMLYVLLGVEEIYSTVISEPARKTLEGHGIQVYYDQCVEGIRNRAGTGICPMEDAVRGIDEPVEALQAIRNKLNQYSSSVQVEALATEAVGK